MSSEKIGRLPSDEEGKPIIEDNPTKQTQGVTSKQDEILAKLNLILTAIDTATDAASLYTELAGVDLTVIEEIEVYN
jgi:hypothetical protein